MLKSSTDNARFIVARVERFGCDIGQPELLNRD